MKWIIIQFVFNFKSDFNRLKFKIGPYVKMNEINFLKLNLNELKLYMNNQVILLFLQLYTVCQT
jgi:hypothetical protein